MTEKNSSGSNQSDLLLWIAGGAIAAVGAAWLVIMQPWAGSDDGAASTAAPAPAVETAAITPPPPVVDPGAGGEAPADADETEITLDNPLRMADLAYDAGMLIEPEEYSAWTLYARVAKAEPDNAAAIEGLMKVADDLIRRGTTALDQGRFDDARATVERVREALPDHAGAKELAAKIWPVAAPTVPPREALVLTEPVRVARVETAPAAPARSQVNPVVQANEAFEKAMAEGRLLTPSDQSAKHYVDVMTQADADHELTVKARTSLSQELLSRAAQSIEALDPEAAGIWIDEAESLVGGSDPGVRLARSSLTEQLIAMETAKPIPASALKIASYVAPTYPSRALERNIEGWVDIEFTVGTDGQTRDVSVTDASHETFFRREATEAVAKWTFEPREFMGRRIEQSSYTRIRFQAPR
jgi:TonB family protein